MKIDKELKYSAFKVGHEYSKEEFLAEINRLERLKTDHNNVQLALKIILNSIYGVLGFKRFICYHKDVAETVTTQSRSLIKFTIKIFNQYFRDYWHKDFAAHARIGITAPPKIEYDVVNYADTDSVMLVMERVFRESGFGPDAVPDAAIHTKYLKGKDPTEPRIIRMNFYFRLYDYALKPYIETALKQYLRNFNAFQEQPNGKPSLKLSIEQINESMLWVAKKMYIKNPMWDDGAVYKSLAEISVKGLEMNRKTYSKWVRGKLKEMTEWIMGQGERLDNNQLLAKLRAVKDQYATADISDICETKKMNDYNTYCLGDAVEMKLAPGCPEHVRAAVHYNYKLHSSEYRGKYGRLISGSRVQFYATSDDTKVFGYPPGFYPAEFAPPVNLEEQYRKTFLDPMNNILGALGIPKLNPELLLFPPLWTLFPIILGFISI